MHREVERVVDFLGNIANICLIMLVFFVTVCVVARYLGNAPLEFGEEVSSYLQLGIVFFGLAYAFKAGAHIRVEVLTSRLPIRPRKVVQMCWLMLAELYLLGLTAGGILLCVYLFQRGVSSATFLHVPLVLPSILIPLGAIASFAQVLLEIRTGLSGRRGEER